MRSAVSLVDVVSPYVQLKRVGRNHVGLCPFHAERTGSFNVRDEIGRYHCFGCGASGDVFRFVQDVEHVDFVVAVEQLAAKAGITLRYTTGGEGRDRQSAQGAAGGRRSGRRVVPPAPAHRARRAAPHGTTCAAGASTGPSPAGSGSAGRPTTGTRSSPAWPGRSGRCGRAVWPSSTGATGCRTPSGPACSSRSSTRPARRSPSVGGSFRAARTRPSTRTRRRPRSTASPGCCTG